MTIDDYRQFLIDRIIYSGSPEEACEFVEAAMVSLSQNHVHGHIIARFLDKMIYDLSRLMPLSSKDKLPLNIETAKARLTQIRTELTLKQA